jgi:hypothetical protein
MEGGKSVVVRLDIAALRYTRDLSLRLKNGSIRDDAESRFRRFVFKLQHYRKIGIVLTLLGVIFANFEI